MRKTLTCAAFLCLSPTFAGEELSLSVESPQFQVSAHPVGQPDGLCLAMDQDGDFVVVWAGSEQEGENRGIFGKRYDKDGRELSPPSGMRLADRSNEFQVNSYTTGDQSWPHVAMDPTGNFVVVWQSLGQDGEHLGVFAKRYDALGKELPPPPEQQGSGVGNEFQVNQEIREYQQFPSLAMFEDGSFVIAWRGRVFPRDQGGILAILARRYDRSGVPRGDEFRVNASPTNAYVVSLAAAANGRLLIAWVDGARDQEVWATSYDAEGREIEPPRGLGRGGGGEFQVSSYTGQHFMYVPGAAFDDAGRSLVAFSSSQDDDGYGVFAKRYDALGNEIRCDPVTRLSGVGNEFQVNSYTKSSQGSAAVATAQGGRFVIVWRSRGQDGDHYGVFAKAYDRHGTEVLPPSDLRGLGVGREFQVNSSVQGRQSRPQVAMDRDGDLVIVWHSGEDEGGIFARRYSLR